MIEYSHKNKGDKTMAKKIIFKTEKAKELKEKLDNLYDREKAEEERNTKLFYAYCQMEGKYGTRVHSPFDCGQGLRGYHYEYVTEEIEEKEKAEREQFLIDNNYRHTSEIHKEYEPLIKAAKEAFYLEQYGMTLKEYEHFETLKRYRKNLERAKKEVLECQARVARWEQLIADFEKEGE